MQIESIAQESIHGTDRLLTTVVITQVPSHCILARLLINTLGRPGVNNDLELIGADARWIITWTYPELTLTETQALIERAIAPRLQKE